MTVRTPVTPIDELKLRDGVVIRSAEVQTTDSPIGRLLVRLELLVDQRMWVYAGGGRNATEAAMSEMASKALDMMFTNPLGDACTQIVQEMARLVSDGLFDYEQPELGLRLRETLLGLAAKAAALIENDTKKRLGGE